MTAGLAGAGVVIKKSFDEMREAEKVGNQTRAVIKSTGAAANVTAAQVEKLAESMSLKAGMDDEAIQSGANLLLTFKRIRNETGQGRDIFNQATRTIVDMSAALDQDLKSSAIQVGKALNDPVRGMTALQRVGVTFDEQQKGRVKRWVEEGRRVRAQRFILRELTTEFGGSAAAQADGFDRIKVSVDNLFESLGETAGPQIEKLANRAAKFLDQIRSGRGAGGEFARDVKEIGEAVLPVARGMGTAAKEIGRFAAKHPQITTIATASGVIAAAFAKFKVGKGLAALIGLVSGRRGGALGAGGVLSKATPVPVFVTNPGFGVGGPGRGPKGPVVTPTPGRGAPAGKLGKLLPILGAGGGPVGFVVGGAVIANQLGFRAPDRNVEPRSTESRRLERQTPSGRPAGTPGSLIGVSGSDIARQREQVNRLRDATVDLGTDTGRVGNRIGSVFQNIQRASGRLNDRYQAVSQTTERLRSRTSSLAGTTDRGRRQTERFARSQRDSGTQIGFASSAVDRLVGKVKDLPARKQVTIEIKGEIASGLRNLPRFLRPDELIRSLEERKGGLIGMRGGGLIPAMLSPGEVGVTPGGGAFKVPGRRVAADTVPALLPQHTAILTASGQRMMQRGASLMDAVKRQLPHFQTGGYIRGAKAAATAGFRKRKLLEAVAIGGAESVDYTDMVGDGGASHGPWQVHNPSHPQYDPGRLERDWTYAARAAYAISSGGKNWEPWTVWREGTYKSKLGRAAAAIQKLGGRAIQGVDPDGRVRVTPAPVTFPLVATQLRPLVDDALLGGIQAGIERTGRGGRVDLLQQILEGIVPESGDRATRERVSVPGRRGGPRGGGPAIVGWMKRRADAIDAKGYPYSSPGNRSFGIGGPMDCSGAVSKVIGPNLLDAVQVSGFFKSWGEGGKGRHVTTYARGAFSGSGGHVFMELDGKGFGTSSQNPGGGAGWFTPSASYKAGFIARHPRGLRRGGMVSDEDAQRIFARLPERFRHPEVLAEIKAGGVLPGFQSGGLVGRIGRGGFDFQRWLRRLRKQDREPAINQLVAILGANQLGTRNADLATRSLAGRVQGRSIGALLAAQKRARDQIRRMAKRGFTGPERIRTRRLRGAISLLQDEMGRPIGRAIGGSDRLQELISRRQSTLPDRLTVMGVDPESQQGLQVQKGEAQEALFRLGARRGELQKALRRARRTGNKQAIRQTQAEIREVDDQMLGLKASIIGLDKTMKESAEAAERDRLAEAQERSNELLEQQNQLMEEQGNRQKQIDLLLRTQGPALQSALLALVNGGIGGSAGLSRSFPSHAGAGGVARL